MLSILIGLTRVASYENSCKSVHAEDGSRIGCGLLETVSPFLYGYLEPLGNATASGEVVAAPVTGTDMICFYGYALDLEPDLLSHLTGEGSNCTAANGCGVHVHAGTSCESKETQMGHYYNGSVDPWTEIQYYETDWYGNAVFLDCVSTGETDYDGKAFIAHANDGSRVACGVLGPLSALIGDENTVMDIIEDSPDHIQLTQTLIGLELDLTFRMLTENFTVFAPTDAAFDAISSALGAVTDDEVASVLAYHVILQTVMSADIVTGPQPTLLGVDLCIVLTETGVQVNGANVVVSDLTASNGVVHVIDAVLLPPPDGESPVCVTGGGDTDDGDTDDGDTDDGNDVVDIILGSPDHTVLAQVVTAYGLAEELRNLEDITVFAPNDAAMSEVASSLANVDVEAILQYHLLGQIVMSSDIVTGPQPTLLVPLEVCLEVQEDGGVLVDGVANVVAADLVASNGVVHSLDSVLTPGAGPAVCGESNPVSTDPPVAAPVTVEPVAPPPTKAPTAATDPPKKDEKDSAGAAVASFATGMAAVLVGLVAAATVA